MDAAWLPSPVMFESSRDFDCEGFEPDQCQYYKESWHNWYVADWTFALPTVAFFMCTIGIFIIGQVLMQMLHLSRRPEPLMWRKVVAATRYLSYRGFHVKAWHWNSAPVGVLVLAIIGTIFFFCMDLAPSPYYWPGSDEVWGNSPPLGTRSGWLALACLPFVFATASKVNWITLVTGVSHEKLQVFHRWISYAFLILALMHTFPFIVWHIRNHDMVHQFTMSNIFEYWTGIVALVFQTWLTFASWSPIRNLGYEFFKVTHFLSAIVFVVVFFWHCGGTLTSWDYFVATAAVYVPCWIYPWLRTICEYGIGQKARISVEDNGFIRITIPVDFIWRPGQHCFLRFRNFGFHAFSSHPFTICSLPSASPKEGPSAIVFYVRRQGGFTARLHEYAMTHPGAQLPVLVDGPYGGIDNQKFLVSDRIVVIAGGTGVGWMLPIVEQFLRHHATTGSQEVSVIEDPEHKDAIEELPRQLSVRGPRSLRVILATRDVATRTFFHSALNDLRSTYKSSGTTGHFDVEVHLTGKAERIVQPPNKSDSDLERSGASSTQEDTFSTHGKEDGKVKQDSVLADEEEVRGRPDLPLIIREEAAGGTKAGKQMETVSVFVCGPLTMQNDARNAVAGENLKILKGNNSNGMYMHLEHFSWA